MCISYVLNSILQKIWQSTHIKQIFLIEKIQKTEFYQREILFANAIEVWENHLMFKTLEKELNGWNFFWRIMIKLIYVIIQQQNVILRDWESVFIKGKVVMVICFFVLKVWNYQPHFNSIAIYVCGELKIRFHHTYSMICLWKSHRFAKSESFVLHFFSPIHFFFVNLTFHNGHQDLMENTEVFGPLVAIIVVI